LALRGQERLADLARPEQLWQGVLKTLSAGIPRGSYLNSFEMTDTTVKITGVIYSSGATADLTRFLLALEQSGFKSVRLESFHPADAEASSYAFKIVCER